MEGIFLFPTPYGPGTSPLAWPVVDPASRVHYGGLVVSAHNDDNNLSGGVAPGRTFVNTRITQGMLQDGLVRQVKYRPHAANLGGTIKAKVMRVTGANIACVSNSEAWSFAGTGNKVRDLTTPMACQPGDWIGCLLTDVTASLACRNGGGTAAFAEATDIQAAVPLAGLTPLAGIDICIDFFGTAPLGGMTGDSILGGHNVAAAPNQWRTLFDTDGPTGALTAEPLHQLRGLLSPARDLDYQNMARGGETWAWVLATGFPAVLATAPKFCVIMAGVNDINNGRTEAAILADVDAVIALAAGACDLFCCEVLPANSQSDANSAAIRSLNTALAGRFNAAGKRLVSCHDAMGQVRASTGQLDDLLAAYNFDAIHLTQAGVDALAAIVKARLLAIYGP